jgi:hypothetical protein
MTRSACRAAYQEAKALRRIARERKTVTDKFAPEAPLKEAIVDAAEATSKAVDKGVPLKDALDRESKAVADAGKRLGK